jgi:uncharacterized membrane protein YdcZ (DUF606 family)
VKQFETRTYKRLGALTGGITGVIAMIFSVCMGRNLLGAVLLIIFICAGTIIGSQVDKKHDVQ